MEVLPRTGAAEISSRHQLLHHLSHPERSCWENYVCTRQCSGSLCSLKSRSPDFSSLDCLIAFGLDLHHGASSSEERASGEKLKSESCSPEEVLQQWPRLPAPQKVIRTLALGWTSSLGVPQNPPFMMGESLRRSIGSRRFMKNG